MSALTSHLTLSAHTGFRHRLGQSWVARLPLSFKFRDYKNYILQQRAYLMHSLRVADNWRAWGVGDLSSYSEPAIF
jgi:hypothetical protein